MQKQVRTRRQALSTAVMGMASGLAGFAVLKAQPARSQDSCGGMPLAEFQRYLALFNENDPRFSDYYHQDVVLELGATQLQSSQAVIEFYAEVKKYVRETIQLDRFISDENGIACEFSTEFRCVSDWDNSFFGRDLKTGEVMRRMGFVHYSLEAGRFSHIKTALYRRVNDWRMEA